MVVFRSRITKQPETVSSWTHYVAAFEWFMHLSFLICWNKASTFLFHCTSQFFRDKEVGMEHASLKKSAKSIRQFVQACLLPQAFCGEVTITLWLICKFSRRAYVKFSGSAGWNPSFEKWSQHKLGSTALIHTDSDDFIHSQSLLILASVTKLGSCQMHH